VKILLSSHHIFVTCKIGDILRACNKEFNFTANYAKGHGGMFFRPGSSGQGQARYNNDMGRAHESMVSGRRGKEQAPNAMIGIFHWLPEELTDSLIVTGRRHGKATRRDFNRMLRLQEEKSEQKEKLAREKKLKASKDDFMNASYLHQQYNSPHCSMTASKAFREFDKLTTNAARYRYLKEQILIHYVGRGWEEAYHPWSKGGYIYTKRTAPAFNHGCDSTAENLESLRTSSGESSD
jgi:hypothetical protein